MTGQVDLNELRRHVHEVQRQQRGSQAGQSSADADRGVFVDRNGGISIRTRDGASQELSNVPVERFADRIADDRAIAATKLPRNTVEIRGESAGPLGVAWAYDVVTEFGDTFKIMLAYDGQYYQGYVVEPEIEQNYRDPHGYHLFSDARICFGHQYNSGMPTLEGAYAKSVVWANGFSVAKLGHPFPWNYDQ